MALVAAIQTSRRAGRADDGGMDGGGTPGGPGTGTPQFRYRTRPFYPRVICLDGGEGLVNSAPLIGCQTATRTQFEPAGRKSGKG